MNPSTLVSSEYEEEEEVQALEQIGTQGPKSKEVPESSSVGFGAHSKETKIKKKNALNAEDVSSAAKLVWKEMKMPPTLIDCHTIDELFQFKPGEGNIPCLCRLLRTRFHDI